MRILVACHSFYPDATGVSSVATNLAVGLANRGHHVVVATTNRSRDLCVPGVKNLQIKRFGLAGDYVSGLRGDVRSYRSFMASSMQNADVFVVHCAQAWPLDALLQLAPTSVPTILVSHGLSRHGEPQYRAYFDRVADWLRRNGTVVGISSLLEEGAFCQATGLRPPTIIPNGVCIDEWEAAPTDVRSLWSVGNSPWIVTVSNHSPVKNHAGFWQLIDNLSVQFPAAKGSIIGRSYPAARTSLPTFGIKGGCWYSCNMRSMFSRRVALQSDASRQEVTSAIKLADVVVVTSHREAAPIVILESMAAGTPWVSLDVGAVSENSGGIVVKNFNQMSRAVGQILAQPECGKLLGKAGKEAASSRHDWRTIVAAHESLYFSKAKSG